MLQHDDFTIDEALNDSMVRMLMKADRVDPRAFEASLRSLAKAQARRRSLAPMRLRDDPGTRRGSTPPKVTPAIADACASW
ncbi:MAG TPA: hypothetical protein VNX29_16695 [Kaistia sp.]|nr:hypothetical protein [Kaistia sp.]